MRRGSVNASGVDTSSMPNAMNTALREQAAEPLGRGILTAGAARGTGRTEHAIPTMGSTCRKLCQPHRQQLRPAATAVPAPG